MRGFPDDDVTAPGLVPGGGPAAAGVPARARPSADRAAAAARLAGAPAGVDDVADRMRQAARRSRQMVSAAVTSAVNSPVASAVASAVTSAVPSAVTSAASSAGGAALAMVALVHEPGAAPEPTREQKPRPRHLRVVPDTALSPAQRRRRARAIVIAGISAAAAIGLALVYLHVVLAQRQFALDRLDRQVHQAQATYQTRRLEVAQLGSPANIIATAEGQLGMVQPAKVNYLAPVAGGSVMSGGSTPQGLGVPHGVAPAGDADWPQIKSQLAGTP